MVGHERDASSPATLSDVAAEAHVSIATASRVLSASTYGVNPELKNRVLTAARGLRYVPNAHARALARSSRSTVGVIVHDIGDPYFAEITQGILRVARRADRLVMICHTDRDRETELEYVALLRSQLVESIIVACSGFDDPEFARRLGEEVEPFLATGGRLTFIGRHLVDADSVQPDNHGGAYAIGREMVRLGHRDIGVIAGPEALTVVADRLAGFIAALRDAGIAPHGDAVVFSDFTREGGRRAVNQLLDRHPELTAVFALNDLMAIGVLAAAKDRGVAVPTDLSLAGFDDISMSRDTQPALTTVRVPLETMGARAMQLALAPLKHEARIEQLPSELLRRASLAPPTR